MQEEQQKTSAAGKGWFRATLLDPAYVILGCCVIVALSFLVSLRRDNEFLLGEVGRLSRELKANAAQVGDVVQSFATVDLEGNQAAVELPSGQRQLLFIFSTSCPTCITQHPVWDRLTKQIQSDGLTVRGVSLDSLDTTRAFFKTNPPSYPVIIAPGNRFSRAYRVGRIPQVMLISERGEVEWVHTGALTEDVLNELMSKVR
jgi:peroxiredoxin